MFDIRWIAQNPENFDAGRQRRGLEPLAAGLIEKDAVRRAVIAKLQAAQERRNAASREIGQAMAAGDAARADALKAEVAQIKQDFPAWEQEQRDAVAALDKALGEIPNLPLDDVPEGADEHGNVVQRIVGDLPTFDFKPKEHFEIGEALGMMDFEAAAKMSGARFVVLKGRLARMERALGQFMLDLHTGEHGYEEVNPPLMVRDEAMFGTAQLPKFRDDQFAAVQLSIFSSTLVDSSGVRYAYSEYARLLSAEIVGSPISTALGDANRRIRKTAVTSATENPNKLWLIPTAEVPLTNLVRESILDEATLPRRYTALTPCFRAEAGSAGRDTRGMIRQHQFTKVEMVSVTTPENSAAEHERMTACAEEVLKRLGLPFRTMLLCTGDMGFASQKTYDIEVWLPGQDRYREISSVSVCGDFQARRMNARYRAANAKTTQFVHTLNGSGVAVGRALVAVLENYQNADGSVTVPDVLQPYMGGMKRIERVV